jgi:hypothetical protein
MKEDNLNQETPEDHENNNRSRRKMDTFNRRKSDTEKLILQFPISKISSMPQT